MPVTVRGGDIVFNDGSTISTSVLGTTAGASALAVGTYTWAQRDPAVAIDSTAAGSTLRNPSSGATFGAAGTWRNMGPSPASSPGDSRLCLYLRIS
jgi:hypothetical protein